MTFKTTGSWVWWGEKGAECKACSCLSKSSSLFPPWIGEFTFNHCWKTSISSCLKVRKRKDCLWHSRINGVREIGELKGSIIGEISPEEKLSQNECPQKVCLQGFSPQGLLRKSGDLLAALSGLRGPSSDTHEIERKSFNVDFIVIFYFLLKHMER